ncbi:MAG TPA: dihydrofolate reductase family protein, partial [Mycobacteriales bacterium]|nr:dihydrofolate reductase family protein [Mycobacteriales bacterium]
ATVQGRAGGLSSPADQGILTLLRDLSDVVMVGAGTIRAEGYTALQATPRRRARRAALGLPPVPPLAIVSRHLDLDPRSPLFSGAARTILLTTQSVPAGKIAEFTPVADVVATGGSDVDIRAAIEALSARGLPHVLCEGGAQLFGTLQAADAADELCLTVSPALAGGAADRVVRGIPERYQPLRLAHVLEDGGSLFLRYERIR